MNRFTLICLIFFPGLCLAQNVGIGTATPAEKLHVAGRIRSNTLASTDTSLVLADFNGTLIRMNAGSAGDVLSSQGPGRMPVWKPASAIVQTFSASSTQTYISLTSFQQISGLSIPITLTDNAVVILSTHGSIETTSNFWGGSGCIIQAFNNGVPIPNAFQTIDVLDSGTFTNNIKAWSFSTAINLTPGSYTFTVRARKYAFDDFLAGGNTTAPSPNEGALIVTVITQ